MLAVLAALPRACLSELRKQALDGTTDFWPPMHRFAEHAPMCPQDESVVRWFDLGERAELLQQSRCGIDALGQVAVQPGPLRREANADSAHHLIELRLGHSLAEHLEQLGDERDVGC